MCIYQAGSRQDNPGLLANYFQFTKTFCLNMHSRRTMREFLLASGARCSIACTAAIAA